MTVNRVALPPEVARFSGLYRFIAPERFPELGIDPEDVPLGTFPAEDHPPFLPDRFGGNAYGLGLFEQSELPEDQARFLSRVDWDDPDALAAHHRGLNDIFKRLGLLVRYTSAGKPFYLIPRQYVAHFLAEVQARTEEIVAFLSAQLSRRLTESLKVGLVTMEHELLLPELQARMPQVDFRVMDNLAALAASPGPLAAVVVVGDPLAFVLASRSQGDGRRTDRQQQEDYGLYLAGRVWDYLEEGGECLCLAERPLAGSKETMEVTFANQGELKRFLMFSHVYRTRRRYKSGPSMTLKVNRFDFHAFLSGLGVYHETVEGLLEGRSLAAVDPKEVDQLPRQDLPLPRGSAKKMMAAWRRWFGPFFETTRQGGMLPAVQLDEWRSRYETDGDFPDTLIMLQGARRRPKLSFPQIESRIQRRRLVGCDRALLARYKDSFGYVLRVLELLTKVREGTLSGMPGLELSRLRKPFETAQRHPALGHVFQLMDLAPRLARIQGQLNPDGLLGQRTPVLDNLEKLSLLGIEDGPLMQLYLIVLGHSTMSRVTFGKLPETSLQPLTELGRYRNLQEAVTILRLYRLLSVAEAAAASRQGLTHQQVEELFALYDDAIRVVTDSGLGWNELLNDQISRLGGVRAKAFRKMLKLFNLFEFLDMGQELAEAGPREKEALAGFEPERLARLEQVVDLDRTVGRFVDRFYAGEDSARPFFFRTLLNCEMHGTGRLLPQLGARAGFTLLWVCVHTSERRLLNFNQLLEAPQEELLAARLAKLRQALEGLEIDRLSPQWLSGLKDSLARGEEAYILDSGLYLAAEASHGALAPRFVDAGDELDRLEAEVAHTLEQGLGKVGDERLEAMDRGLDEVARFLEAQQGMDGPAADSRMGEMERRLKRLAGRLEEHILSELFDLARFREVLSRLITGCPRLMDRLLPEPAEAPPTRRRLAAAAKLSALSTRSLNRFQDMQQSHELCRAEFGPTAAGIVGVSPLQFQTLNAELGKLTDGSPGVGRLLMLAVLLHPEVGPPPAREELAVHPLVRAVGLDRRGLDDLGFLLEQQEVLWRVVSGQASRLSLEELLRRRDPVLVQGLFLLSVVKVAASREGALTEDLLERFNGLMKEIRGLMRAGQPANRAQQRLVEDTARQAVAFEHYREIQEGEAPTASLRYLLETVRLPEQDRDSWLAEGVSQSGLERLLRLRGLMYVSWLDLKLLLTQVPVVYIYRLKGLRSMGVTHFERDLYEALRLNRGLNELEPDLARQLLAALGAPPAPLCVLGFDRAAERLTYPNQARLMLLGLAAARHLELETPPRRLSFGPLAEAMELKFEMVNEALGALDTRAVWERPALVRGMLSAREGLGIGYDPRLRQLGLFIADPVRIDRKIEAVRRAKDVDKLKRLYHRELKKLKLTHYHTLDYGRRLEAAFEENLARLGEAMMERVRRQMASETSLDHLRQLYREAWDQGLELPLRPDRQESLRDLFEMNAERIRAQLLSEVGRWLASTNTPQEVDKLWQDVRQRLASQRRELGKDFYLVVAQRFDQRAAELEALSTPD